MNLTRLWWALGVLAMLLAAVFCLMPMQQLPSEFNLNDKASHLAGHAALAIYFAGLVPRDRWWKIFAFLLLFGILVEFAQAGMNLGRHGDYRDVLANALGDALGLLLARLGLSRWPEWAAWLLGRRGAAQ